MFAASFNLNLQRCLGLAALLASSTLASALPQDLYEPNDSCAATPLLPPGLTTGLTIGPDEDYFLFAVPNNADLYIDVRDGQGTSIDCSLYEVGCGTLLADGTGAPLSYFDCGGAARDLVLYIPDNGQNNVDYSIDLSVVEVVDDNLEDNDTCNSGALVAIQSFTTPNLVVTGCDEDYYVARLQAPGVQIQVDLLFAHAQGDVDLEFWDLGCTTLLGSSTTMDDNESLMYTNNTAGPMAIVIRTFMKNGTGWADYALTACFASTNGSPPNNLPLIGAQVCAGLTNSTGRPATLCARGSDVAANNSVYFYTVDLPTGSAGYFITSPTFSFTPTPGNTMGNLCLGSPGRYSYNVLFTQNGSAVFYQPDLVNTPVAGGTFGVITAGTRQFWQYWYRDSINGMSTSNFSSALCIDFL
ncbi:MAG: hypothetical protein R3F49_12320 [Planctomycetota bacterium]